MKDEIYVGCIHAGNDVMIVAWQRVKENCKQFIITSRTLFFRDRSSLLYLQAVSFALFSDVVLRKQNCKGGEGVPGLQKSVCYY